ncbi:hypothetical protein MUK42_23009 [Musa troglodytarum]|uniref:Uncharacterized protein n=1 Tax=Musa troglodytarum TaxID=320322 RepID=A0A9E7IGG3_9LILI|nr:hypothetical protein MUK42_23009 [Musa troglodytarum]
MASTALAKFGPPVSAIARRSPTSLRLLVTAASADLLSTCKQTEVRCMLQVDDIGNRAAEMVQDAWKPRRRRRTLSQGVRQTRRRASKTTLMPSSAALNAGKNS